MAWGVAGKISAVSRSELDDLRRFWLLLVPDTPHRVLEFATPTRTPHLAHLGPLPLVNMVQKYNLFGTQVASHYVSHPIEASPPALPKSPEQALELRFSGAGNAIANNPGVAAGDGRPRHIIRRLLRHARRRQHQDPRGSRHQRLQLRRGRLHQVRSRPHYPTLRRTFV